MEQFEEEVVKAKYNQLVLKAVLVFVIIGVAYSALPHIGFKSYSIVNSLALYLVRLPLEALVIFMAVKSYREIKDLPLVQNDGVVMGLLISCGGALITGLSLWFFSNFDFIIPKQEYGFLFLIAMPFSLFKAAIFGMIAGLISSLILKNGEMM